MSPEQLDEEPESTPLIPDAYEQCLTCETWHYCRFARRCNSPTGHTWGIHRKTLADDTSRANRE